MIKNKYVWIKIFISASILIFVGCWINNFYVAEYSITYENNEFLQQYWVISSILFGGAVIFNFVKIKIIGIIVIVASFVFSIVYTYQELEKLDKRVSGSPFIMENAVISQKEEYEKARIMHIKYTKGDMKTANKPNVHNFFLNEEAVKEFFKRTNSFFEYYNNENNSTKSYFYADVLYSHINEIIVAKDYNGNFYYMPKELYEEIK